MASYAIMLDGKNTGKRADTSHGFTATDIKRTWAEQLADGDKKRITLVRLI